MQINKKFKESLQPFYSDYEVEKATQFYVPTQCQNIAPSKEEEPGRTAAFATKQLLIPFFLKKGFTNNIIDKFYIIMADSGMGKTTFMINLYLNYAQKLSSDKYHVKLLPLGYPGILEEIDKIPDNQREKTILLLDAFDEDNEAIRDYRGRLREILSKVDKFKEIVITCRTQFFPSEEEEPKETGVLSFMDNNKEYTFRKLYISPFDEKDIKGYLSKKYTLFQFRKKQRAEQIVKQSPNLMVRPMLLTYIDDLIQSKQTFQFTHQVYSELIARWIEREVQRYVGDKNKYREELYQFSKAVSIDIYQKRKIRNGLLINAEEVKPLAELHKISLDDLELKSRSLLNRNARGQFKFSHKSILEYFLALECFNNAAFEKEMDFEGMEQAMLFLNEMFFSQAKLLKGKYKIEKTDESKELSELHTRELRQLKYLSLRKIDLTDLNTLRGFKKLDKLQLNNIQLGAERLDEFLHKNTLNLSRKYLLEVNIIKDLTNLKILDMSFNQIVSTESFRTLVNLESLNLSSNKIEKLTGLKELLNLTTLDLSDNRLKEIDGIQDLQNILNLDLSYNEISDGKPLQGLKKITVLNLSNNKISNINDLQGLTSLTSLNLTRNLISPENIEILKAFLPKCDIKF